MDVQLYTTIAPDILYMYAKNKSSSSSQTRVIHVSANLATHPPEGLNATQLKTILAMSEPHIHLLKKLPSFA